MLAVAASSAGDNGSDRQEEERQTRGESATPPRITPSKAFVTSLTTTFVVLLATKLGLPISSTHASVGAVLGIGLADGRNKFKQSGPRVVLGRIAASWLLTLPAVMILTILDK